MTEKFTWYIMSRLIFEIKSKILLRWLNKKGSKEVNKNPPEGGFFIEKNIKEKSCWIF